MKKALVTGASSGIGKSMALYLNELGYSLILVSRDKDKLMEVASLCKDAKAITCNLTNKEEVYSLYDSVKDENIDFLINNAGFGIFGYFNETSLDKELEMINLNIVAVHILTKLFLKDMIKKDSGYILNVASMAGFLAGPYLNTYYATKNYVLKLTMAINEELKQQGSHVSISALCPGPVDTNFNKVAGGSFKTKSLKSDDVAKYGVNQTLKRKMVIVPSFSMKALLFVNRFISNRLLLKITYNIQKSKSR